VAHDPVATSLAVDIPPVAFQIAYNLPYLHRVPPMPVNPWLVAYTTAATLDAP
jgi:hypothetical protein